MRMADLQDTVKQQVEINDNAYTYQQGIDQKKFAAFVYSQGNTEVGGQMMVDAEELKQPAEDFLLEALSNNPELASKFEACYQIDRNPINNALTEIVSLSMGNDTNKFQLIQSQLGYLMTSIAQVDVNLQEFRNATMNNVQSATTESQDYAKFSNLTTEVSFSAIAIVALFLAAIIGKRITNPLKKLTDIAGKVSSGELDHEIEIKTGDEISDLGEAFQRMINAFKMTVALSKETEEGTQ
jgi:methyl-accepting chemotaxis protein